MKPATAAKKLDVYLPATPAEFQEGVITRAELEAMQADPPSWLRDLRINGPHPKNLVAMKLGISKGALVRHGITEALTTEQINALLSEMPDWLEAERATQVEVRTEAAAAKSAPPADRPRSRKRR
ncbi:hypothetical protein DFR67_12317 [Williamsia limnetica]|uniref:Uncharacterized protein n=1 Tax=Williamsia limnetica TaxID=882452 RepID=A0A318RT76_WILLI|nr:DUF5997 family protein [Williamsia limnetica]PYE12294.1 hypothetical protein DFR67_12317 [Williamsia limnetica]